MCAEKSAPPIASSGDTRATSSASHARAWHHTRQRGTTRPRPARCRYAPRPRAYNHVATTKAPSTAGASVQARQRSCGSIARPGWASAARGASASSASAVATLRLDGTRQLIDPTTGKRDAREHAWSPIGIGIAPSPRYGFSAMRF